VAAPVLLARAQPARAIAALVEVRGEPSCPAAAEPGSRHRVRPHVRRRSRERQRHGGRPAQRPPDAEL